MASPYSELVGCDTTRPRSDDFGPLATPGLGLTCHTCSSSSPSSREAPGWQAERCPPNSTGPEFQLKRCELRPTKTAARYLLYSAVRRGADFSVIAAPDRPG